MGDDILETWNDIAHHLDDWGPPLRLSAQDVAITRRIVACWCADNHAQAARVFLCGVTPEIVTMAWPCAIELVAMDRVESMVRVVWPGDIAGVRRAVVGDWLQSGVPASSQDIVVGDGGFGFFDYPDGQRRLARALRTMLQPNGLFLYRYYAQLDRREALDAVLSAAREGLVGSFHAFKWRVAMALQTMSCTGVRLHDVWEACTDARLDVSRLPQPGWSDRAVSTIRFYKNRDARLYFPTLEEFRDLLAADFEVTTVEYPDYELGERCPHVAARPRHR